MPDLVAHARRSASSSSARAGAAICSAASRRPGRSSQGSMPSKSPKRLGRLLVVGDARPVDEVLRPDVLADGAAAEEAGADGHASAPDWCRSRRRRCCSRCSRRPAAHVTAGGEGHDRLGIRCCGSRRSGRRRRCASCARLTAMPRLAWGTRMEAEHGAQLLAANGSSGTASSNGASRILVLRGDPESRFLRDPGRILADRRDVELALGKQVAAQPVALLVARRDGRPRSADGAAACRRWLPPPPARIRWCRGSNCRRTCWSTMRLAALAQVGRGVDEHRRVAGPDADRRIAGAVGGAHHRRCRRSPGSHRPAARIISVSISAMVGSSITWTTPSGAPAFSRRLVHESAPHRRSRPWPGDAG